MDIQWHTHAPWPQPGWQVEAQVHQVDLNLSPGQINSLLAHQHHLHQAWPRTPSVPHGPPSPSSRSPPPTGFFRLHLHQGQATLYQEGTRWARARWHEMNVQGKHIRSSASPGDDIQWEGAVQWSSLSLDDLSKTQKGQQALIWCNQEGGGGMVEAQVSLSSPPRVQVSGTLSHYHIRWTSSFASRTLQFLSHLTPPPGPLPQRAAEKKAPKDEHHVAWIVDIRHVACTQLHLTLVAQEDTNNACELLVQVGSLTVRSLQPSEWPRALQMQVGMTQVSWHVAHLSPHTTKEGILLQRQQQQVFSTRDLALEISYSAPEHRVQLAFRCRGLEVDLSMFIIRCISLCIGAFAHSSSSSSSSSPSQPSQDTATRKEKVHLQFSVLFRDSSLFFCDAEAIRKVALHFEQFQILQGHTAESVARPFFTMAYSGGEAFYRSHEQAEWEWVLRGSPWSLPTHTTDQETFPDLLSDRAGHYAYLWTPTRRWKQLHLGLLETRVKPLVMAVRELRDLFATPAWPDHPSPSSSSSSSSPEGKGNLEVVAPPADTERSSPERCWSVQVGRMSGRYLLHNERDVPRPSFLHLQGEGLALQLGGVSSHREGQATLQHAVVGYGALPAHAPPVALLEVFGAGVRLDSLWEVDGYRIHVHTDSATMQWPLNIMEDLALYVSDSIALLRSLQHPVSLGEEKIRDGSRYGPFQAPVVSYSRVQDPKNWNEHAPWICFPQADRAWRMGRYGYGWRGDVSSSFPSSTPAQEKEVVWHMATPHRLRRVSWTNEGADPRSSVVRIQYYEESQQAFVDWLAPLEENCARNQVDRVLENSPVASCWRLLFSPPPSLPSGQPFHWPFVTSFSVYADPVGPSLRASPSSGMAGPSHRYLQCSLALAYGQMSVSSTLEASQDHVLLQMTSQVTHGQCLLALPRGGQAMQWDGTLQSHCHLSYQDLSHLAMRPLLTLQPRLHLAWDGSGQLALRGEQLPTAPPLQWIITRPALQLLRNISHWASQVKQGEEVSWGMFFHFHLTNRTSETLQCWEVSRASSTRTEVVAGASRYWKWSLLSPSEQDGSTSTSPGLPYLQRRLQVGWGDYQSPPLDITHLGFQRVMLRKRGDAAVWSFLLHVTAPTSRGVSSDPSTILPTAASHTLNVTLWGAYQWENRLHFPIRVTLPSLHPSITRPPLLCPSDTRRSPITSPSHSPSSSLSFALPDNHPTEPVTFHIATSGSSGQTVQVDLLSHAFLEGTGTTPLPPQLIPVRSWGQDHQWAWLHTQAQRVLTQDGEALVRWRLILSPIYAIHNEMSLPLLYRVTHQRDQEWSEGRLDAGDQQPLYMNPRRRTFIQWSSALLPDPVWTPSYELSLPQRQQEVPVDSGMGQWMHASGPLALPLRMNITTRLSAHHTRILTLSVPYVIRNETLEGVFLTLRPPSSSSSSSSSQECVQQLYVPPGRTVPFCVGLPEPGSSVVLFAHRTGSRVVHSLRATAPYPQEWAHCVGVDPTGTPGDYVIGYHAPLEVCATPWAQEEREEQEEELQEVAMMVCHFYLLRVEREESLSSPSSQTMLRILPSFLVENQTSHAMVLDQMWMGAWSQPPLPLDEPTVPPSVSLVLPAGRRLPVCHWLAPQHLLFTGQQPLSILLRREGTGWDDHVLTPSPPPVAPLPLRNALTRQHDRLDVTLNASPEGGGQRQILLQEAPDFALWFVNLTAHPVFVRLAPSPAPVWRIEGCASEPLSLEDSSVSGDTPPQTVSVRTSEQHRWTEGMAWDRPRHVLFSLYGPRGSESLHLLIEYQRGSVYFFLRQASSVPSMPTRGLSPTPSPSSDRHVEQKQEEVAPWMAHSQAHLQRVFPFPTRGMQFTLHLPQGQVLFWDEEHQPLLRMIFQEVHLQVDSYAPRQDGLSLQVQVGQVQVQNSRCPAHVPLQWGEEDQVAFGLRMRWAWPYRGHVQSVALHMATLRLHLTVPFLSTLFHVAPPWWMALQHPTTVHHDLTTPPPPSDHPGARRGSPTSSPVFINQLEVGAWGIELSWLNTVGSRLQPVLLYPAKLLSITELHLQFRRVSLSPRMQPLPEAWIQVARQYQKDLFWQLLPGLGSMDLLGNPTRLVRTLRHYWTQFVSEIRWRGQAEHGGGGGEEMMSTTSFYWRASPGLAQHAVSVVGGSLAALVECGMSFQCALIAVTSQWQIETNSSGVGHGGDERSSWWKESAASDALRSFLHTMRLALEEAMRNTVTQPMQGFRTQGVMGAMVGGQDALRGWLVPTRLALQLNNQWLHQLHTWLLVHNTLPPPPHRLPAPWSDQAESSTPLLAPLPSYPSSPSLPWTGTEGHFQGSVQVETEEYGTAFRHPRMLLLQGEQLMLFRGQEVTVSIALLSLTALSSDLWQEGVSGSLRLHYRPSPSDREHVLHLRVDKEETRGALISCLLQTYYLYRKRTLPHHHQTGAVPSLPHVDQPFFM